MHLKEAKAFATNQEESTLTPNLKQSIEGMLDRRNGAATSQPELHASLPASWPVTVASGEVGLASCIPGDPFEFM